MKVRELMTTEPITVEPDATLGEVATLMKQEDCGSIPVVEKGRLIGIVTDRDIVVRGVAAGTDPKTQRVRTIMSADPVTIGPDEDVTAAQKVMADRQIRRLPVVERGSLVGIVVTAQIARAGDNGKVGETLKEISKATSGRGSHARG
jgi:predicted transcriptional regulator